MTIHAFTPFPAVNELLGLLLPRIQEILSDQFVGAYLFGSLANGDFDDHSDIDLLVITRDMISRDLFLALQAMHRESGSLQRPYANQLEISYIPVEAIRRYSLDNNQHPHLDRGNDEVLRIMQHESDWVVQRYLLRERGITLKGPAPKSMIDPISADDLRSAMRQLLFGWYAGLLSAPHPFGSRGYQSYTVLSLCRILYTLQNGEVVSKSTAAGWAKATLDPCWIPLIERAILGRQQPNQDPELPDTAGTLAMIEYALQLSSPTLYPAINQLLSKLLADIQKVLGDQFVGMYLYGSLAAGDFSPRTSDIDFVVITTDSLRETHVAALKEMHERLWSSGIEWAAALEGSYVPQGLIRKHDPDGEPCPTVNEKRFYVDRRGSDWVIQRHIIREFGVVLAGPDPKSLIDPVMPDDIRAAVRGVLHEWWFPMLDDPSWLQNHGDEYHAFAILTMCRALYALEHGAILSKPAAARWAQEHLEPGWRQAIERSLRPQGSGDVPADLLDDALSLIRYTRQTLVV